MNTRAKIIQVINAESGLESFIGEFDFQSLPREGEVIYSADSSDRFEKMYRVIVVLHRIGSPAVPSSPEIYVRPLDKLDLADIMEGFD